jgi:hypothetical protein
VGRLALRAYGATYWTSEQSGVIDRRFYRLVVSRSSASDPRTERAVNRAIATERDTLDRTARALAAGAFACEADAQAALDRWQAAAADTVTTWHVVPTVEPAKDTRRPSAIAQCSAFLLITTVPADPWSTAELLAEYQGQVPVERHFTS